jgi:hypothetical protein
MTAGGDLDTLRNALVLALDANIGVPSDPDERVLDAEALAAKCLFHASSCRLLGGGTIVANGRTRVLDIASLNVLVRATLESSLVFHHLFVSPQDAVQAELRSLSWALADLLERQGFTASLPESQEIQRQEREQIEAISNRLEANTHFQGLTQKQQRRVLEDGYWSPGWAPIAHDAGLSDLHATQVHRYLSSYAHSGSLSVLQLRQAKNSEDRRRFLDSAFRLANIGLAVMIKGYCSFFPKAGQALQQHPLFTAKVDEWIHLAKEA